MAVRSRPWDVYGSGKLPPPPPSRLLWPLLTAQLLLIVLGSFYAAGSVLRRANHLGRACSPPGPTRQAGPAARFAMVSLSEEKKPAAGLRTFEGLTELVWRNKQAYAAAGGYDFVDGSGSIDHRRPISWSKIKAVLSVLHRYDWVLWNDAVSDAHIYV